MRDYSIWVEHRNKKRQFKRLERTVSLITPPASLGSALQRQTPTPWEKESAVSTQLHWGPQHEVPITPGTHRPSLQTHPCIRTAFAVPGSRLAPAPG